ncbi:MAG: hypothetical protein HYU64_11355 [Armatimonadetes bacterium]|nr:hypothetical protein [Armatimonadota bacterium]
MMKENSTMNLTTYKPALATVLLCVLYLALFGFILAGCGLIQGGSKAMSKNTSTEPPPQTPTDKPPTTTPGEAPGGATPPPQAKKEEDMTKMPEFKVQEGRRDPFVPLVTGVPVEKKGEGKIKIREQLRKDREKETGPGTPEKPKTEISLTGIMGGRNKQAILVEGDHSYIVRAGDSFKGGRVSSITENTVVIVKDGQKQVLKIKQ